MPLEALEAEGREPLIARLGLEIAIAKARLGRHQAAEAEARELCELAPGWTPAIQLLGELLAARGAAEELAALIEGQRSKLTDKAIEKLERSLRQLRREDR